jgi:hypothetical protein
MASLQDLVTFDEVGGDHAILCRRDPHTFSGNMWAESRCTTKPQGIAEWLAQHALFIDASARRDRKAKT